MRGRRNVPPPAVHTHAHTNVFFFHFVTPQTNLILSSAGSEYQKKSHSLDLGAFAPPPLFLFASCRRICSFFSSAVFHTAT